MFTSNLVHAENHNIDQVIDLNALTPEEIYRFDPNYLWIEPGDTIRFLNSTGNHTVTSINGMWPKGAPLVKIEHKSVANVTFDIPGIYGFKCKVHGRHGMYALIVVGSPDSNINDLEFSNIGKLGREVFENLLKRMKKEMAKR
ncbi:plastocyanin/azurin family copper-binding protein [Kiloniella litopenaei]|uniref:plastocyanin/azurin family copper-binding protein n=1 Tax=Kiloniella litopenaei TaxID=1549748 RepID=UPI003BABF01F